MMLTQQETNKMKDRDEQHSQELREWRADIGKRKQVCYLSVTDATLKYNSGHFFAEVRRKVSGQSC